MWFTLCQSFKSPIHLSLPPFPPSTFHTVSLGLPSSPTFFPLYTFLSILPLYLPPSPLISHLLPPSPLISHLLPPSPPISISPLLLPTPSITTSSFLPLCLFPFFSHQILPSSSSSRLLPPSPTPICAVNSSQVQLSSVKTASGKEQAQGYKFQFKTDLTPKSLVSLALSKKAKSVGSTTKEDAEDYILKVR